MSRRSEPVNVLFCSVTQRRLGDPEEDSLGADRSLARRFELRVLSHEAIEVDHFVDQEVRVAHFLDLDLHPAHHLAADDFDVLVDDRDTLEAIDLLDLVDQVALEFVGALDLENAIGPSIKGSPATTASPSRTLT